ncbi:DUF6580 family putative transport protein [Mariniblastus fucicola]|uniref:Uncharacterized protein n=1 Tax=Mariniblastus fucicola TaxID=980251 RepID=A0A5B9P6Q7_9BACT|nr:DUF6580 family putative transport protein [Mariniblastus fucicola]QEG20865.1 hypothetical protein MFFC18_07160 [Mariniblastus fucicola]
MKRPENILRDSLILLLLVAVGIGSRFVLADLPNFKPVAAIVLFAAFAFRSYLVAGLALVSVMLVSNSGLDHCPWQVTLGVVGGLGVAALLGVRLGGMFKDGRAVSDRPVKALTQFLGSVFAMSLAFFLISNFSVWSMGQWYPVSLSGLAQCFTAAIPFFKYTLGGDMMFATGVFAVWYAVECRTVALPTIGSQSV